MIVPVYATKSKQFQETLQKLQGLTESGPWVCGAQGNQASQTEMQQEAKLDFHTWPTGLCHPVPEKSQFQESWMVIKFS